MRGEAGVSLRLRAVQVLKYIPMEEPSPFEEEDGFDSSADLDNAFQEEQKVEEPKKLVKKSDPVKPPNQQTDDELSDIVDNWDD